MPDTDDTPKKSSLPLAVLGLAAAFALALWAGIHYMTRDASLFYGLVAGLSFGAAFAFGQQIKNRIAPSPKRQTDWKVKAPGAAELNPASPAARISRAINSNATRELSCTLASASLVRKLCWPARKTLVTPAITISPSTIAIINSISVKPDARTARLFKWCVLIAGSPS